MSIEKGEEQNTMSQMMGMMMDQFLSSMPPEKKKELMKQMMPKMMKKMTEGLTAEDRQELMASMMPVMMSQMFGGEGGLPSMMPQEDFKPWEFCPCREICEKSFKKEI